MSGFRRVGVRFDVPHYVYRCYDDQGVLLYVGCSNSPVHRIEGHRRDSWWAGRIHRVRYTVFPNRDKALEVERRAIYAEQPICNVKGRWQKLDPRTSWTLDDYRIYRLAVVNSARGFFGTATTRLLATIDAEVSERFGVSILAERASA